MKFSNNENIKREITLLSNKGQLIFLIDAYYLLCKQNLFQIIKSVFTYILNINFVYVLLIISSFSFSYWLQSQELFIVLSVYHDFWYLLIEITNGGPEFNSQNLRWTVQITPASENTRLLSYLYVHLHTCA